MIDWMMRRLGYIPADQIEYIATEMYSKLDRARKQRDRLSDLLERKQRTIDCQIETIQILRGVYSE